MYNRTLGLILALFVLAVSLSPVKAQTVTPPTATPPPVPTPTMTPVPTPTVPPTVTPVVIEVRQPPQPAKSFWEQYGVITALVSGIIGGILVLVFQKLLGPTVEEWGRQLNEWRKGAASRFRKKYISALTEEHHALKLVGIHGREELPPPRLKEVYVTLQMGSAKEGEDALGQALTIDQSLSQQSRLLILGEPGAGKSTLLDYLTLVFCGDIAVPRLAGLDTLLPVYLSLRRCTAHNRALHAIMSDQDFLPLDLAPPEDFFTEQLEKGRCLVLLDGLDEVIDQKQRDQVADKINQLVRTFPDNRYVVTCRIAGWREGLLTGDFSPLYIRNFSDTDIERFAIGWYRAVRTQAVQARLDLSEDGRRRQLASAEQQAGRDSQVLIAALRRNPNLYRLARNPLILSLIALVHYRRRDLPKGRAKLYQECLEILLEVWDNQDKELAIEGPSLKAKETILREIAYHFHVNKITERGREELEQFIEPLIPQLQCPTGPAETLRQIEERSGILVTRAINSYVFAHRTLQEYLVALVLASSPTKLFSLGPHLQEERWREVILLYAGLVKDATKLIQFILTQPDDADLNLLILAGQCLAEDVRVDETERAKVLGQLETAFRQPETAQAPLRFRRLGETLAVVGGADVLAFFANLLAEGQPVQRAAAATALGQVGKTTNPAAAADHLVTQLTPTGEVGTIRAICLALAELGVSNERVLATLERVRQEGPETVRGPALWALLELGQAERYGMVKIPAGEFLMGSDPKKDKDAQGDEQPQHRLYLPDYYIGKTPVTNAQYAAFVQATRSQPPEHWKGSVKPPKGIEDHPVVNVSWNDALAYCRWLRASLPSEAEWEKAARGTDGRIYPWGDEWEAKRCNTSEGGKGSTTPVSAYPEGASPYGVLDMAGNVWEWCATKVDKPYPYNTTEDEWSDDYLKAGRGRVLRGGSFGVDRNIARCACRLRDGDDNRGWVFGFRVVASPSQ